MVWDERVMRGVRTGVYLSLPFRTNLSLISLSLNRPPSRASSFSSRLGASCQRWFPVRGLVPLLRLPVSGSGGEGGVIRQLGSEGGSGLPPQSPGSPPLASARRFRCRVLPPRRRFSRGCAFLLPSGLLPNILLRRAALLGGEQRGGVVPPLLSPCWHSSRRRRVPSRREGSSLASSGGGHSPSPLGLLSPLLSPFLPCPITLYLRQTHKHFRGGAWAGCTLVWRAVGRARVCELAPQRMGSVACLPLLPDTSRAVRAAAVYHSMQLQVCAVRVCVGDSACLSGAVHALHRVQHASQRACVARAPVRRRSSRCAAVLQLLPWQQQQQQYF